MKDRFRLVRQPKDLFAVDDVIQLIFVFGVDKDSVVLIVELRSVGKFGRLSVPARLTVCTIGSPVSS